MRERSLYITVLTFVILIIIAFGIYMYYEFAIGVSDEEIILSLGSQIQELEKRLQKIKSAPVGNFLTFLKEHGSRFNIISPPKPIAPDELGRDKLF